jgi:hypothetical protein
MSEHRGEVIYLADVIARRAAEVRPKSEARTFHNQRYTLQFDPNAPEGQRWHWLVKFTRVFEYRGSAADITRADKAAKAKIAELETRERTG